MTFAEFRSLMERHGPVIRDGADWRGRCPAHTDDGRRGDLTFTEAGGKIILHCWGGCDGRDVVRALGLQWSDLFSNNGYGKPPAKTPATRTVYPTAEQAFLSIGRRLRAEPVYDWTYRFADGREAFLVGRFLPVDGDKTYRPIHPEGGGYVEGDPDGPLPLYCLPEILRDTTSTVYVSEGEKAADAGASIGLLSTTSAHGAKSANKSDWSPMAGRDVVILPDNDDDGERYASDVRKILLALNPPAKVRVVRLPGLPAKGDLYDYVEERDAVEPEALRAQIEAMAGQAEPETADAGNVIEVDAAQPHLTDSGNAERFAHEHRGKVRYCWSTDRWLHFDGARWNAETGNQVAQSLAAATARGIAKEALDIEDIDRRRTVFQWSCASQSAMRIRSMLTLARDKTGIASYRKDYDGSDTLFNLANCTIDYRDVPTVARSHAAQDMLTQVAGAAHDPNAQCPLWTRCVDTWMGGDPDKIAYLQRLAGYCLIRGNPARVFPVWHGAGRNGKSVCANTWLTMMGDYGTVAPRGFLAEKFLNEHSCEIASLMNKRLVIASETKPNMVLSVDLVKEMTGEQMLKARFMRQDPFEFAVTHKVVLMTNSLPVVKDTSDSIWDRVQLLEWNVRIPDGDVDANLPAKLKSEWSGILNWMLDGLRQVQEDGWDLRPPETVRAATGRYRSDSDVLQRFVNDCCVVGPDLAVPVRDLRPAFDRWAEQNAEVAKVSTREFNGWLRSKGFVEGNKKTNGLQARHWFGLGAAVTEVTGNLAKLT